MNDLKVSVPAKGAFVQLLRAAVAGVGARQDLSWDAIDDLRLAVDEAAALLLAIQTDKSILRMKLSAEDGHVKAILSVDATPSHWPPPPNETALGWQILRGLTDEAEPVAEDGEPAIRLVKNHAPKRPLGL